MRTGDTLQGMNANLILLTLCQGLFFTKNVTFIAINGLVGLSMAPLGWMATLPVMGYVVGGALSTGLVHSDLAADADALLLKLLARRGMALCQLSRYDEAATDYGKAVALDPDNEQLQNDLRLIEAARATDAASGVTV